MHQTIIEILERGMPVDMQVDETMRYADINVAEGYNTALSDIKSKLPSIADEIVRALEGKK